MAKLRYKNVYILIVTLLMALGNAVPAIAGGEPPASVAGQVVFAVGDAYVVSLSGPQKATMGSIVLAGDRLVTGVNGYVHLRMADGAFLGVRSDSLLEINEYMFDIAKPENGRVRLFLKEGTVRAISGRIAHENKQNFYYQQIHKFLSKDSDFHFLSYRLFYYNGRLDKEIFHIFYYLILIFV